jgi:hypothetical protein
VRAGRVAVWYLTFTDASGWAGWVHVETVAPSDGSAPYKHGWTALFPPVDAGPPVLERFEDALDRDVDWKGSAGRLSWDLSVADDGPPLYTFPKTAWDRHLLPGAQIVPSPTASVTGTIGVDDVTVEVAARGAVARIFGHGSADRWGWLHAPLGDDGVLEIVTASAHRPGLRRVPPLAMIQLRLPGERDWPANPLLAAPRFRTELRPDGFSVRGRGLSVDVTVPPARSVTLGYVDPDGSTATCTNSEQSNASITFRNRTWQLDGTAHAEVGRRP